MVRKFIVLICCTVFLSGSCKQTSVAPDTYFDSLVVIQVKTLTAIKAGITKVATIGAKKDEVFRQLKAFSQPTYRNAYVKHDKLKDANSNLLVLSFHSEQNIPVQSVRFLYHNNLRYLRKIEATFQEKNILYSTNRHLTMDFEDVNGVPVLSGYNIEGVQKMITSDSIHFSVAAIVHL
jgi:hypothetical protein